MKALLAILCILSGFAADAQLLLKRQSVESATAPRVNAGFMYLWTEDFETPTSGYEQVWSSAGTAVVYPAYTTAPLAGSQSLYIDCTGAKYAEKYHNFPSANTVYFRFKYAFESEVLMTLARGYITNATSIMWSLAKLANGTLRIYDFNNSHNATTTTAMSTNTVYTLWVRYTSGAGTDAVISVGFSADLTEPTSGASFAAITNGSSTNACGSFMVRSDNLNVKFDELRCALSTIGSNP